MLIASPHNVTRRCVFVWGKGMEMWGSTTEPRETRLGETRVGPIGMANLVI
jgi:hypothetical protein